MSIIYKEGGIFLNIPYFIRGKGVFVIFTEHQEQLKKLFDNKSQLDRFWSFVLFDQVILNMFWKQEPALWEKVWVAKLSYDSNLALL